MIAMKNFLQKKNVIISLQRYGIDAPSAMSKGLFCSLLIGTILNTIGSLSAVPFLTDPIARVMGNEYTVGGLAMVMSGPAMAVAIGSALKAPVLVTYSLLAVGLAANAAGGMGGPLAVLVVSILTAEIGKLAAGETRVDIIVTPLITTSAGMALTYFLAPLLGEVATIVSNVIGWGTEQQPFIAGILVSSLVGLALTMPISSAAICAALGITGLAGGAALAGCCAQMVGFAVISYKQNGVGGLISQGLGTSMLQIPNIVRNPRILIAPTLTSVIMGPVATCIFRLEMNGAAINSGMGTCALCGQIGVFQGWVDQIVSGNKASITAFDWTGLILISFILPMLLAPAINNICLKCGLVKEEEFKL